jgi:hypothetical protein
LSVDGYVRRRISVREVSASEYDEALDASEEFLRELGERLDEPVEDAFLQRAMLALGRRARSHFLGVVNLLASEVPSAAFVLLRPATEVNLTVRFLADRPDVHLRLWEAEAELDQLKWVQEIERDPELAAQMQWPLGTTDAWQAEAKNMIALARELGLKEEVKGVSTKARSPVMPNMRDIAHTHGDLSTRQAYAAAYRPLSLFTHASARGFTRGAFIDAGNNTVTFEELTDPEHEIRSHRSLNSAIYASTLTVVAEPLELNILDGAARTRDALVNLTIRPGH